MRPRSGSPPIAGIQLDDAHHLHSHALEAGHANNALPQTRAGQCELPHPAGALARGGAAGSDRACSPIPRSRWDTWQTTAEVFKRRAGTRNGRQFRCVLTSCSLQKVVAYIGGNAGGPGMETGASDSVSTPTLPACRPIAWSASAWRSATFAPTAKTSGCRSTSFYAGLDFYYRYLKLLTGAAVP